MWHLCQHLVICWQASLKKILHVFYAIQVQGPYRLIHQLNIFTHQELCDSYCTLRCSFIIPDKEIQNHCNRKQIHMKKENLNEIAVTSDWTSIVEVYNYKAYLPKWKHWTSKITSFIDFQWVIACSLFFFFQMCICLKGLIRLNRL